MLQFIDSPPKPDQQPIERKSTDKISARPLLRRMEWMTSMRIYDGSARKAEVGSLPHTNAEMYQSDA